MEKVKGIFAVNIFVVDMVVVFLMLILLDGDLVLVAWFLVGWEPQIIGFLSDWYVTIDLETIQQDSQEQIQKYVVAQENPQNKVNHSEDLIIEGV